MTAPSDADRRPSFSLVVPLYNEKERISESFPHLADFLGRLPHGSEVIFVDDGSGDETAESVEALISGRTGMRLLRRPHQGKGAAVMAGLSSARGCYAGFCDVDLSTPLDQLEEILEAATAGPVLAIGSRDVATSKLVRRQSLGREALGRLYNRLVQVTLAPGLRDTQCGAKVAAKEVWDRILPLCQELGFAWDVEATAVALRLGINVHEIGIEWSHDDRSRVRTVSDGYAMLRALPRIWRSTKAAPSPPARTASQLSAVFDEGRAQTLLESDTSHWWFRSKAAVVSSTLRRTSRLDARGRLVDIGAGAGGVTVMLGWSPARLVAVDGSVPLARRARAHHGLLTVVADISRLPLRRGIASVVTLLDVIEHLDDPVGTLREASTLVDSDGVVVVIVPAHQWLWSQADELLGHRRRYTRSALKRDVVAAGLTPLYLSHFFSWLLVPVWAQRRLSSDAQRQLGLDRTSVLIDRLALVLTRLELLLLALAPLPFGTSIICVASPAATYRPGEGRPGAGAAREGDTSTNTKRSLLKTVGPSRSNG